MHYNYLVNIKQFENINLYHKIDGMSYICSKCMLFTTTTNIIIIIISSIVVVIVVEVYILNNILYNMCNQQTKERCEPWSAFRC